VKKVSKPVFYFLGILFFLIATGGWGLLSVSSLQIWYLLAQVTALGLGIGHVYLIPHLVPDLEANKPLPGLVATVCLTIGGVLGIIGMYAWFFPTRDFAFSTCVIPFLIPYVVAWVYRYYLAIPAAEYKKWYYPLGKSMPDLDLIDLSKILVIQFEFPKKLNDSAPTNFKAKAPLQMTLGELFLIFINDYNEQNATSGIQFLDEKNTPLGWHFYYRKGRFSSRYYFDPDLSFQQNNIADNLIIKAERS
jgi:hypothetical protein